MRRFNKEPKLALSLAANVALAGASAAYVIHKKRQTERENAVLRHKLAQAEKQKAALHDEATHDKLTGVLNTRGLEELLAKKTPPKAMLYVDGTKHKAVNDNISHDRGDDAIVGTAETLKKSLRPGDVVARIGGDEFLVLLDTERRSDEEPLSPDELLVPVTSRIAQETQVFLGDNPDLVEAGFNIAVGGSIWQEGMSVVDMRAEAEQNMYKVKQAQHQISGQHRP